MSYKVEKITTENGTPLYRVKQIIKNKGEVTEHPVRGKYVTREEAEAYARFLNRKEKER